MSRWYSKRAKARTTARVRSYRRFQIMRERLVIKVRLPGKIHDVPITLGFTTDDTVYNVRPLYSQEDWDNFISE